MGPQCAVFILLLAHSNAGGKAAYNGLLWDFDEGLSVCTSPVYTKVALYPWLHCQLSSGLGQVKHSGGIVKPCELHLWLKPLGPSCKLARNFASVSQAWLSFCISRRRCECRETSSVDMSSHSFCIALPMASRPSIARNSCFGDRSC